MQFEYNGYSLKSGIYQITNKIDNKIYIGSCKLFKIRAYQHLKSLKKQKHSNRHLQASFNKYGTDAFMFEVLEIIEGDKIIRTTREKELLDEQIALGNWENCYNFQKNPIQNDRSFFSKNPHTIKQILSEKSKKLWQNPEFVKKITKSRLAATGTEEYKQNLVEGLKNSWKNNPNRREKFSKTMKEKYKDPEYKEKVVRGMISKEAIEKSRNTQRRNISVKEEASLKERMAQIKEVKDWIGVKQNRAKDFTDANLLSPDGIHYKRIYNLNDFAKNINFDRKDAWKL
jgi:group I intron endonuclease